MRTAYIVATVEGTQIPDGVDRVIVDGQVEGGKVILPEPPKAIGIIVETRGKYGVELLTHEQRTVTYTI